MNTTEFLNKAGCKLEVICDKGWNDLVETDENGIRYCGDCRQLVFYTTTTAELRVAAKRKLCVYLAPEIRRNTARNWRPDQRPEVTIERIRELERNALSRLKGPTLGSAIIR
jgi:hypothetical protein